MKACCVCGGSFQGGRRKCCSVPCSKEYQKARRADRKRKRYKEDELFRQKLREKRRAYYAKYRATILANEIARLKRRYQTDPEYRRKVLEQQKLRKKKARQKINKWRRERYWTNPEFRQRLLEENRERYHQKASANPTYSRNQTAKYRAKLGKDQLWMQIQQIVSAIGDLK